ncbi:probable E3 ubiquitin-protein ligase rbra [Phtheirospermum japonicum]|uniref:RBR-type E3 ubiquitin transferase n=1 Tax=Phtheirospermum japonicum TaxID=374723 RepID=A0A830C8U5_9LAMI|nr:probable E3 ubiquitin-protein ligase rbra [Phtheirospermum japonicum]
MPEAEWGKTGNNLCRPFAEGSSSSNDKGGLCFRVYLKGLMENMAGGIGVAVYDGSGGLVFELSKGFSGKGQQAANDTELAELKALVEGLDVALLLDLKRVSFFTDNSLLHQLLTGKTDQMAQNAVSLHEQKKLILRKFSHPTAVLVTSNKNKFAIDLARNAIAQVNRSSGSSNSAKNLSESCAICFEDTYADQMFVITCCFHRYCFPCMSKHVQFKLLQGSLPKCPHENCTSKLKLDSCKNFLTPELFVILSQRMKEASIPAEDKIYCPYPKCSTLLSKTDLQGSLGPAKCPECSGAFCTDCKVPWHRNMDCVDFKKLNPYPCKEDKKLKDLATENLWRQCPKCCHMVSLARGCYHIYCRCGHEFCYTCGAEWKNKKATCTCLIWDERNIIYKQKNRHQAR